MTEEVVSNKILTVPNLISFARLLTVPVFWWVLLAQDDVRLAAILIIAVGWSDWIDGYLARRLHQVSKLGKNLDPIADRVMIASAIVAGLVTGIVPPAIGYPLIAREVFMAIVTALMVSKGAGLLTVRYLGKFATTAVYSSIPSFYLVRAGILVGIFEPLAWFTGVVGLVTYWIVAFVYVGDARRAVVAVRSRRSEMET